MKKGKRLSKADGLRVLIRAYHLIKNRHESFICVAIVEAADMLELADRKDDFAYELIPELRMFKPINKRIDELWFDSLDEDTRLYILRRLIDIYNDNDHSDIVKRIARKIRSIF